VTPELDDQDGEEVLAQFNQLIDELLTRSLRRNVFRRWEIEILVDLASCNLRESSRRDMILRSYRRAMQEYLQGGARAPLKLSEYLKSLNNRNSLGAHGT
jgi:hypothetical protein